MFARSYQVLITTDDQLEAFVERALRSEVLAIDTEFMREKTYSPRLCLLQMGTDDEQVAVDPFCVRSVEPLRVLFSDPSITKVLHACSQDMEVILQYCGVLPRPLFDTQIAAGFLGDQHQIGYGPLVEEYTGVSLPKTESLTDWTRRPLDAAQLEYALDDVRYLPRIWREMRERLERNGRLSWLEPEFAHASDPATYRHDPREAFRRVKHVGSLSRRQLAVAREVAAWRDERARELDRPRRWVLADEILVEVSRRTPTSTGQLARIRGMDGVASGDQARILAAVRRGLDCPPDACPEVEHRVRPSADQESVCDLMYALTRMVAERERMSSSLLASRDDLVRYLLDRQSSPVAHGWRADLLGGQLDDLLEGRLGLTVKGGRVELL
ncbi:MAG: ribonuclease D [Coriobacteriia bacterium]|nr:ribonuclease D [Coriobacteriia bacterium]MBS5477100.1 ribonuclease D [Coriobacteriia bacterium]